MITELIQKENPNSDLSMDECKAKGLCVDCGGQGIWTDFGQSGKWKAIRCNNCGQKGIKG